MKNLFDYGFYFVTAGVLLFVVSTLKKLPTLIGEKLKDARQYEFNRLLQVDEFYRKDGNLQSIMMDWANLAIDDNVMSSLSTDKGKTKLKGLLAKTVGYGSKHTDKLVAMMLQNVYTQDKNSTDYDNYITLVLIATIVSSLKKDFTGENIEALDILKIKIKDFNENEALFVEIMNDISKRLGDGIDET